MVMQKSWPDSVASADVVAPSIIFAAYAHHGIAYHLTALIKDSNEYCQANSH